MMTATGIAKSTLSRVENDQLSLTYSKLQQLCKGLQIDIAELFASEETLVPDERTEVGMLADELRVLKQGDDLKALRAGTEALDKATRRFAELMMDAAVSTAIRGETMESAGDKLGEGPTAPHPFAPAEFKR